MTCRETQTKNRKERQKKKRHVENKLQTLQKCIIQQIEPNPKSTHKEQTHKP